METAATIIAPEGIYSLTDELKPVVISLASSSQTLYPTRVSTVTINFPSKPGAQGLSGLLGGRGQPQSQHDKGPSGKDKDKETASGSSSDNINNQDDRDAGGSNDSSGAVNASSTTANIHHHPLFAQPQPTQNGKRKAHARPKHNMKTTSSAFITRHQATEGLNRILQQKQGDATFVIFNSAKSIFWSEAGIRAKDPLARVTFSAYPTCHDINMETVGPDRLDVIIGFNTGDLIWFDAISSRYMRLNKQGGQTGITSSACTAVRWVPRSPSLFLVSHADGTMMLYDKERDDPDKTQPFIPTDPDAVPLVQQPAHEDGQDEPSAAWEPTEDILVSRPPWHPSLLASVADPRKIVLRNPLSHWKVSRRAVHGFVFSPDLQYIAVVSEDGCLRIIDALHEKLLNTYASYFGALTCVDWSPDGRFVLTGGQDDLVTVISPWEQRTIARCQGHSSFISAVKFDTLRCDARTYRFGSVAEDSKLILWDFSSGALHRPKLSTAHHNSMNMAAGRMSSLSLVRRHHPDPSMLALPANGDGKRFHAAPPRSEVASVQPAVIKVIEGDMLTAIDFLPTSVMTANKAGLVKVWVRPLAISKSSTGRPR
ncbi:WD40 repeat-like protein [Auriculariales sp. MPI-PUGE-AT-0066]|nr:WD40 repeat-like protein [Auriculariales sp. MPI-PUGE-AT-0066]